MSGGPDSVLAKHANCLPIGTKIADYEIIDLIGEGGFGIVYLARDLQLDRIVAVKEFMPAAFAGRIDGVRVAVRSENQRATFETGLKSFINEARMLAKFSHPALLEVFRFWEGNGTAYMVMRLYDGKTLRQALSERTEPYREDEVAQIMGPIFDALEMLHRDQIYHRDIAPDNIMLADGRSVLLDFGAARRIIGDATQALTTVLKPGYAPIEQYSDDGSLKQGAWTDVYALGAVLYHLATGKSPLQAVSRMLTDPLVEVAKATDGRFSDGFSQAVSKAMAVHVNNRFQTVTEFRQALGWNVGLRPQVVTVPSQQFWVAPENAPVTQGPKTGQPAPSNARTNEAAALTPRTEQRIPVTQQSAANVTPTVLQDAAVIRSDNKRSSQKPSDPTPTKSKSFPLIPLLLGAIVAVGIGLFFTRPKAQETPVPAVASDGKAADAATTPAAAPKADEKAASATPAAPALPAVVGEGTVRFATKVEGRVDINGIARGWSTSLGDIKLPVGAHKIDIIPVGAPPISKTIDVKKDEVVVIN